MNTLAFEANNAGFTRALDNYPRECPSEYAAFCIEWLAGYDEGAARNRRAAKKLGSAEIGIHQ